MMLPPKPTLLMLWIARANAIFALGMDFTKLVLYSQEPDRVVISGNPGGFGTTGTQVVTHYSSGPTTSLYFMIILFACLACGLFALNRSLARFAVAASALVLIAMSVFGTAHILYLLIRANTVSVAFMHVGLPTILVCTAVSLMFQSVNIWLALRPPVGRSGNDHGGSPFLVHAPTI